MRDERKGVRKYAWDGNNWADDGTREVENAHDGVTQSNSGREQDAASDDGRRWDKD